MAVALTNTTLVTYVRQIVGEETAASSAWSDAKIIVAANRVLEDISMSDPVRLVQWTITGDGTTTDWLPPEAVTAFDALQTNGLPAPQVSYGASLLARRYFLPVPPLNTDYGFAMAGQYLTIRPAIESGGTRSVYYRGMLGTILATAMTTGTVTATLNSTTVTSSATPWGSGVAAGDSITITTSGTPHYYVVASVDSTSQITLTEKFRQATGAGKSYSAGSSTGLHPLWNSALAEGTVWKLRQMDQDPAQKEYEANYRQEKLRASSAWENLYAATGGPTW